ncbi:citrulline utilization hydrolase CtlX [Christiangramia sabulilitoris]|uniref:Amidinotransferase n=1 Tax=Christiangramia sabulilitoris TaxID=2583991 RepID=A0A550I3V5_9FLAO|nr:arginine deiminase-related protein [Christiangramia sabulilitoris]TRO65655.1 amidinotransferase [Christiangramia sabulilitoris]
MRQITDTILMVRPVGFRMNEQTAVNNYFQQKMDSDNINEIATQEFDIFVGKLRSVGVNVIVVDDVPEDDTPDSIFPNNWVSFHENGQVALFPMFAENRRKERRLQYFSDLEDAGYKITDIVDYTIAEEDDIFLEGTGSLILDRQNEKAYCAISPRADEDLLIEFCEDFEFTPVIFNAYQSVEGKRLPIYHTNVIMCIAEDFAVICLDTIDDKKERKNVLKHLKMDGKEIISISEKQMHEFAGNMLQVQGEGGKKYLVMSARAHRSLTEDQLDRIEKHCEILSSEINAIETCGGGSARCMMAEVFLPKA